MAWKSVALSGSDVSRLGLGCFSNRDSGLVLSRIGCLKKGSKLIGFCGPSGLSAFRAVRCAKDESSSNSATRLRNVVDETQNDVSKRLHKDLSSFPRPLTVADLSSTPNNGTKMRISFKVPSQWISCKSTSYGEENKGKMVIEMIRSRQEKYPGNIRVKLRKGVSGSYSEDAALKAYPNCETVPCGEFEDAFKAVELWLTDKAVLPIENSSGGSIHRNYDLLLRHRLHIVGEVQLAVNLCLLALPGVRAEHLKRVLSHPQALELSDKALTKLGVTRENVDDTAGAAQLVALNELRDAGVIASARAAGLYGLNILAEKIQDDLDNVTRFLVLARDPIIPGTDKKFKTSIVFTLEEGPGVLFKALAVFALREINLSKIESRPQRKRPLRVVDDSNTGSAKYFDYLFYIDFEASMAEPRSQNALGHLQEFATFLRVLGCYPMDSTV